ncbi:phospholipase A and acyltransferase 3-like [Engraulis encrasicolus]|uniref:phospholipase A and acyltransferase 3-like n=1 Tax=Engraulis encrasicolus TaxID=184585 RepID=UPI002FD470F7
MAQKVGDLIEFFRGGYEHWAVYIGEGYVIHLTSHSAQGSGSASVIGPLAIVKKEKLEVVAGKSKWRVNNIQDSKRQPRPTKDIIMEATAMVGKTVSYKLTKANCEHFATYLRYGKPESRQVSQAEEAGLMAVAVGAAALTIAGAAAAAFLFGGGKKEKKSE